MNKTAVGIPSHDIIRADIRYSGSFRKGKICWALIVKNNKQTMMRDGFGGIKLKINDPKLIILRD